MAKTDVGRLKEKLDRLLREAQTGAGAAGNFALAEHAADAVHFFNTIERGPGASAAPPAGTAKAHVQRLTESQQQAFDLICKEGPLLGRQIVTRLGIGSDSTFTTHYVPALKQHGVENRRGLGYYHPDHYRAE
jgi:hypothetical protein